MAAISEIIEKIFDTEGNKLTLKIGMLLDNISRNNLKLVWFSYERSNWI